MGANGPCKRMEQVTDASLAERRGVGKAVARRHLGPDFTARRGRGGPDETMGKSQVSAPALTVGANGPCRRTEQLTDASLAERRGAGKAVARRHLGPDLAARRDRGGPEGTMEKSQVSAPALTGQATAADAPCVVASTPTATRCTAGMSAAHRQFGPGLTTGDAHSGHAEQTASGQVSASALTDMAAAVGVGAGPMRRQPSRQPSAAPARMQPTRGCVAQSRPQHVPVVQPHTEKPRERNLRRVGMCMCGSHGLDSTDYSRPVMTIIVRLCAHMYNCPLSRLSQLPY